MMRFNAFEKKVGSREGSVLLRVVGEEHREQPEHDVGHPHG